jgi:U4/U6.U5 tri-snRNP-associated protein 2
MHKQLGGNPRKQGSSIIYKLFQGQVHMQSQEIVIGGGVGEIEGQESRLTFVPGRAIVDRDVQFLMLTLDLPAPPLFQDEVEKNIIPQVDIFSLLAKYDGRTSLVKNLVNIFVDDLGISRRTTTIQDCKITALSDIPY